MLDVSRERDERSIAVEQRAGNAAYQVVGYLLILDMVLHTWRPGITDQTLGLFDRPWPVDILLILLAGGLVQWSIILRQRVVGPHRAKLTALLLAGGTVLAAVIALVLARLGIN